ERGLQGRKRMWQEISPITSLHQGFFSMKSHSNHPNRRNEVPSANAAASQAAKRPSSFGGPAHDEK
ncbi:hypothetical protein HN51_016066, partial [Arachis hypogaea]